MTKDQRRRMGAHVLKQKKPMDETFLLGYVLRSSVILSRTLAVARIVQSVQQESFTRRQYKVQIEGHLTSPFYHFLSLSYESLNDVVDDERAERIWEMVTGEVEYELAAWVLHPIQGFTDREKAIHEALKCLRRDEAHNRRVIEEGLRRKHNIQRVRRCPQGTVETFFRWVGCVVSDALFHQEVTSRR
jgi:hypothetical protein